MELVENRIEKNMENEMETEVTLALIVCLPYEKLVIKLQQKLFSSDSYKM